MYKVKDNVGLNKLTEYGFIHLPNTQMWMPRYKRGRISIYYDCWKYLNLSYEEANKRRIKMGMAPFYNRVVYIKYRDTEILKDDADNDIYDLIRDGIVEEVEEEKYLKEEDEE